MTLQVKVRIAQIKPYVGGKTGNDDKSSKIFKLSSNENPLGCSPKAITAYKNNSHNLNLYPCGHSIELRKKIATVHNLNYDNIVCGAGSDELISLLCQIYSDEKK